MPSPVVSVQLAVLPYATRVPQVVPSFEKRILAGAEPEPLAMLSVTIVVFVYVASLGILIVPALGPPFPATGSTSVTTVQLSALFVALPPPLSMTVFTTE